MIDNIRQKKFVDFQQIIIYKWRESNRKREIFIKNIGKNI